MAGEEPEAYPAEVTHDKRDQLNQLVPFLILYGVIIACPVLAYVINRCFPHISPRHYVNYPLFKTRNYGCRPRPGKSLLSLVAQRTRGF